MIKESIKTLDLTGKITIILLMSVSFVNFYNLFEAYNIGSYDRATSHGIYGVTLLLLNFVILLSSYQFDKASKLNKETREIYDVNYQEKRMEMYEKLLENKVDRVQ